VELASEKAVNAALLRLSIAEVPTTLSPDRRSRPPHLRSWRDGRRHLRFLMLYHGVVLPYNYLSEAEWNQAYNDAGLRPISITRKLKLYPNPTKGIFGGGLHFIAFLAKL
jgi:hypothetical protein